MGLCGRDERVQIRAQKPSLEEPGGWPGMLLEPEPAKGVKASRIENVIGTSGHVQTTVTISDEPGKAHDADDDLQNNQGCRSGDEEFALVGFERIGEDSTDEGQQKGQCPQPGAGWYSLCDQQDKNNEADQRCGVSEVARTGHAEIQESRSCGGNDNASDGR